MPDLTMSQHTSSNHSPAANTPPAGQAASPPATVHPGDALTAQQRAEADGQHQRFPTRSVSDPAVTKAFAIEAARILADDKCEDVLCLDVRSISQVSDFIIIASGTSDRQMRSAGDDVAKFAQTSGYGAMRRSQDDRATWIVLDSIDVVIHIFEPNTRAHYDLEMLWGDSVHIDWRRPEKPSGAKGPAIKSTAPAAAAAAPDDGDDSDDDTASVEREHRVHAQVANPATPARTASTAGTPKAAAKAPKKPATKPAASNRAVATSKPAPAKPKAKPIAKAKPAKSASAKSKVAKKPVATKASKSKAAPRSTKPSKAASKKSPAKKSLKKKR